MRPDTTKRYLAQTLMDMCDECRLAGITVSALVERAGVSRPTFYRHFDDINDAICYAAALPTITSSYPFTHIETTRRVFQEMKRHRSFYTQLPDHRGQNNWWDASIDWNINEQVRCFVPADLSDEERMRRTYVLTVWTCGFFEGMRRWCASGMQTPVDIIVDAMYEMAPAFIREGMDKPPLKPGEYPH